MLIYGKNTVKEAILANRNVYIVYLEKKFIDRAIINLIEQRQIKVKRVSKHDLNAITDQGLHQGIVAEVENYQYNDLEFIFNNQFKNILILDRIVDPHNFGAIIRTAEAAGIDALVVGKKSQATITSTVAKIASGAIEHLNFVEVDNLLKTVLLLKENNFVIIAATLDGEPNFKNIDKTKKQALIIGNEGMGISYVLKEAADYLVKIPMVGKTNSLNASVAAALLIYEMRDLFKE